MLTVEQLVYPLCDALAMDFDLKNGRLFGEETLDLALIEGIPMTFKVKIVDSVIDDQCGTVGAMLHMGGRLFLAMINDDRCKKLTFLVVDGKKAEIKFDSKTGRVGKMDSWGGWSRKKFYAMIAPGVKATFTRPSVEDDWTMVSEGPQKALAYLEKRRAEEKPKTQTAEELNRENAERRSRALTKRD